MRDRLLNKHDVSRQHQLRGSSRQQQHDAGVERGSVAVVLVGIDSLSDVLLTRVLYSGLRTDDLCRCAAVCRRWNRLVWNPLLWTSIDLSQAPDCDADSALRYDTLTTTFTRRSRLSKRV